MTGMAIHMGMGMGMDAIMGNKSLFKISSRVRCTRKTASAALQSLAIPRGFPAFCALQPQLYEHNSPRAEIMNRL